MYSSYNVNFIGKVLLKLNKIDSTNNYAAKLLKNDFPIEGTVIYAKHQYAGRGQRGNTWETNADENLTVSIILYPKTLGVNRFFYLNECIALGAYALAKELLGDDVRIKWPNDIYYKDQKIGGILIENTISGQHFAASVVGIGINVNQTSFPETLHRASSLKLITNQQYNVLELLTKLCRYIEMYYLQLKSDKLTLIHQKYLSVLYRFGEHHDFVTSTGEKLQAKIVDVNPQGQLLLEYKDGPQGVALPITKKFNFKEIQFADLS